jgi:hypothetical protein
MLYLPAKNNYPLKYLQKIIVAILVPVLFCVVHKLQAQNKQSPLMIAVSPDNSIIRLDTALFRQTKSHFMADTGIYLIKAWAPGRKLLTDTIHVSGNGPVLYRKKLEKTNEYKAFKHENRKVIRKVFLQRVLPGLVTAGSAAYFTIGYNKYKDDAQKHLDKCTELKSAYEGATGLAEVTEYRDGYLAEKERYDSAIKRANDLVKQATIILPVEIVTTGVLWYVSRKLQKPVFTETPLLSDLNFDYNFFGNAPGPRFNYVFKF